MTINIIMPAHILPVYARRDVTFSHGEGVYLFDDSGKRYLDFASGIGVNTLGHQHLSLMRAMGSNIARPWHTSNGYRVRDAELLANKLCAMFDFHSVFFCNSGTEAMECAIKGIRAYYNKQNKNGAPEILSFYGSFHGRCWGAMSASDSRHLESLFHPMLPGFRLCEMNRESVLANLSERTSGIILEPIQGHNGCIPFPDDFLIFLRNLCDERDILLCYDCIQSGYGRTGDFFAYERSGAKPDIAAVAKGMAGGLPMGACILNKKASVLSVGQHGSTIGGNPLCCSMANVVLDEVLQLLPNIRNISTVLWDGVCALADKHRESIESVSGRGFMISIKLKANYDPYKMSRQLLYQGLITTTSDNNSLRLLPPFIIDASHVAECCFQIDEALKNWSI